MINNRVNKISAVTNGGSSDRKSKLGGRKSEAVKERFTEKEHRSKDIGKAEPEGVWEQCSRWREQRAQRP